LHSVCCRFWVQRLWMVLALSVMWIIMWNNSTALM
jgi:hypothetical protein